MSVLFLFIRVVEFVAVVAVIGFIVYAIANGKIGDAIAKLIKKRSDYYDVEKLDDAEIIARKYNKKNERK